MKSMREETGVDTMVQWDEVESQIGMPAYLKMAQ